MSDYTKAIREAVGSIVETNLDPATRFQIIAFSGGVDSATSVSQLKKPEHGTTKICQAFKKMHSLIAGMHGKKLPERIIIIFVSDGEDEAPIKCVADLKTLPSLPCDSTLLTVGVGKNFPTGLVVDVLRPKYHKGPCTLPPVLPIHNTLDLPWAFGQLEGVLLTELTQCTQIPSKVDDTTSTRVLIQFIRARYNECVVKCAESGRTPRDNLDLLNKTTARMHEVALLAKARVVQDKAALKARAQSAARQAEVRVEDVEVEIGEEEPTQKMKPLLSNLISASVYHPKTCLTLALSVVKRLNTMMACASKGQLISDLPDDAKKELIGFAYTEGRLMGVASKYRAANFSTTKQSLLRLLRTYQPKESDKGLQDPINLADQAEYFADARDNLLDLIPFTHTLNGIVKVLPFVGRTLTFKTPLPIDALQMNEWLAEVVELPMVHRFMTTYDFYTTFNEAFTARGETVNGLMILGGDPNSPGIFHHLQSMVLLKHPGLFVLTARLAVAGSVLAFILGNHATHEGWMDQELDMVREVCANYPKESLGDWHLYMGDVISENHIRCLVAESPKLPKHCKCPGLTKYLLALYLTTAEGHKFTMEELKVRHMALVTEFLARCKAQFFDYFDNAAFLSPQTLLDTAWEESDFGDEILSTSLTYTEARDKFALKVEEHLKSARGKILVGTSFQASKLYNLTHYQLSLHKIGTFFSHLANQCLATKGKDAVPEFILSKHQLIRAMHTVQMVRSAYERTVNPAPMDPIPKDELQNILSSHFSGKHRSKVMGLIDGFVKSKYEEHHRATHLGLARPIPSEYIERFREEFGLDIGIDWGVGAGGLSTLACCSPDCPHFLKLLETRRSGQEPIVCRKLRLHLSQGGTPTIPGFHKTVLAFQNLAPEHVASKITSGECLRDPYPTKEDMVERTMITDRISNPRAYSAAILKKSNPDALSDLAKKLEELKSTQAKGRRDGLLSGLQHAVSNLSSGDPSFLSKTVGSLQGQLESPPWRYDDFRSIFLKQYKKHPELAGKLNGGDPLCEPTPAGLFDKEEDSEPAGHA
jgi:hypothetical protein